MYRSPGEMIGVPASSSEPGAVVRVWPSYFPDVEFAMDDRRSKLVTELAGFFSSPQANHLISQARVWSHSFSLKIRVYDLLTFANYFKQCRNKSLS